MIARKNNVTMRNSNDNIDHENVVIIELAYVCR